MSSILGDPWSKDPDGESMLAEVTVRRLSQFRLRRLRLVSIRGAGWAVALAVVAILFAVAIDGFFVQTAARWIAAGTFYFTAIYALFHFCIVPWTKNSDLREEARRMEQREPELEDQLLSAVELSKHVPSSYRMDQGSRQQEVDSSAFRNHLQQQVARAISGVDIGQMLPWNQVKRAFWYGVLAIAVISLLALVPGLHLPQRIARTLLPFANLGRISIVTIEVENPSPASQTVALDDVIAFSAIVTGPQPKEVWLELRGSEWRERVAMDRLPESVDSTSGGFKEKPSFFRFECTLIASQPRLDYRISASGTTTPWYRLEAVPRPSIERFTKRITPPDYLKDVLKTEIEESTDGNVRAMKGSRVELAIAVSEPMDHVFLRWEDTGELLEPVPLRLDEEQHVWVTDLSVHKDCRYRIDLESKITGLKNDYSPLFEIEAVEDLPPLLRWLKPQSSTTTAVASALLPLSMQSSDEFPLAQFQPHFRLNENDWQNHESLAPATDSTEGFDATFVKYDWELDLLKLQVEAGDLIEIKVLAQDQNGAVVESDVRRVLVSSATLDLEPTSQERARREIAEQLEQLARNASDLVDEKSNTADFSALSKLLEEQVPKQIENLLSVSKLASLTDASELRDLGNSAAKLSADAKRLQFAAERELSDKVRNQLSKRARQLVRELGEISSHARSFVSHDTASRWSGQLRKLAKAEKGLSEKESSTADQLKREQHALLQEMRALEQSVLSEIQFTHERNRNRLRNFATQLGQAARFLEDQIGSSKSPEQLRQMAENTAKQLQDSSLLARMDGNLYEMSKQAHRLA